MTNGNVQEDTEMSNDQTVITPQRLWGIEGAERMYFDATEAYESQIDGTLDHEDEPGNYGPVVLEEREVEPVSPPSASWIVEWVAESTTEEFVDDGDTYADLCDDPDLLAKAEELRALIAGKITWRQAGALVEAHKVTLTVHDNGAATAFLDGEVFYEHPAPGVAA